jgi:hypothetical protein
MQWIKRQTRALPLLLITLISVQSTKSFGNDTCPQILESCDLALKAADKHIADQRGVIDSQAALILNQKERITILEKKGSAFYEKEWFWFAAGAFATAYIVGQTRK